MMKFGRMVDLGGSSPILVEFGPWVSPPRPKSENVGNVLDSREPGVTNWPAMTLCLVSHRWLCSLGGRHVGIYTSQDNWRTC